MTPSQYIGSALKTRRIAQGMTGSDLAKLAHVSQQQISRYECGKNAFHIEMLHTLFFVLKMDAHDVERLMRKAYLFSINTRLETENQDNNKNNDIGNGGSGRDSQYNGEYGKEFFSEVHRKIY